MATKNLMDFNDANFDQEVLRSSVPVLVDFTGEHCAPCKRLAPIVAALADDVAGVAKVGKLDVQESPGMATKYRVFAIPKVMVFKGGQIVAQSGLTSKEKLREMLGV
jgi:thioredoxin 1